MVDIKLSDLGIAGNHAEVRDLWLKKELGLKSGVRVKLRPHASMLYRVSQFAASALNTVFVGGFYGKG
jgi:hypothetical protein